MNESSIRRFSVAARSTEVFGRVLCSARNHHFVIDGPIQNGCPGEALTPTELFVSAVASCGVELIQVIARDEGAPLTSVAVEAHGMVDRGNQARADLTLLNEVRLQFILEGVDDAQANKLVEGFKRR
jgi:uncharacterized OsmC-like protein